MNITELEYQISDVEFYHANNKESRVLEWELLNVLKLALGGGRLIVLRMAWRKKILEVVKLVLVRSICVDDVLDNQDSRRKERGKIMRDV